MNSSNKFLKYSIKWDYDRPTIRRITRWIETTITFAIVDVTLHNTYTTETGTLDISCKSRTTTNVSNWRSCETRKKEEKRERKGKGRETMSTRHDRGGWKRDGYFSNVLRLRFHLLFRTHRSVENYIETILPPRG